MRENVLKLIQGKCRLNIRGKKTNRRKGCQALEQVTQKNGGVAIPGTWGQSLMVNVVALGLGDVKGLSPP